MAAPESLVRFVRDALDLDVPRPRIEGVLQDAGWRPEQVKNAMAGFAEVEFPVPVPRPTPYLSAREAFFYLALFASLYVSAINLGALMFELINRAVPDPAVQRAAIHGQEIVRWSVSYLVVAFPTFLYLSRRVARALRLDPNQRYSKIRRWLTYLTLFLAGGTVIGDVVALVYNLLGGELGVRIGLKVLTVGAIAGSVYAFYLRDLRKEEEEGGS